MVGDGRGRGVRVEGGGGGGGGWGSGSRRGSVGNIHAIHRTSAPLINHRIFTGSDLIKDRRITGYIIHGPGIHPADLGCHRPLSSLQSP